MTRSSFLTCAHWGVYHVDTEEGRVTGLRPFGGDPDPSPIGQGLAEVLDGKTRITQPMVRKSWLEHGPGSHPERRGEEEFVPVSWEKAEQLVAQELDRVRKTHGNKAIYGGSYGWASAGRFHHAPSQLHRFLNTIGGYTKSVNTYSFAAAEVAVPHVLGSFLDFVNTATSWSSITGNTDLFVAFGGIPVRNGQIDQGGVLRHIQNDGVRGAAEAGTKFVNIGPNRAAIPECADAQWLAPRPCTDTAILLGIAYVLLSEGLVDQAFLDRCTAGFGKVADYLTGEADGIAKTPEWAATISGLDAAEITSLSRRMAKGRTMISVSWSLTRQQYGEQPFWAGITVAAMLGQIGLPGGGIGFGYSASNGIGAQFGLMPHPAVPQGVNKVQEFIPVARIADMLLDPGGPFDYNGRSYTYPDIRLIYWAGGNPFHHHQDLNRLRRAWQKPDTIITHEWCWTATAKHSDIVLPCTTHVERNDIAPMKREGAVVAMEKAAEPAGEARNDHAIFAGIARLLEAEEAFTGGRSEEEWIAWIYDKSRSRLAALDIDLPTLEQLRRDGIAEFETRSRPVVMLEDFVQNPDAAPLKTPSGRIELFSETVAGFGYSDCPGHAAWLEPKEWLGSASRDFPFHLVAVQPSDKLHSQLDHGPVSQSNKISGRETARINPQDAAELGIADGDVLRVFNGRGSCLAAAKLDPGLRPKVLEMATGTWFEPERSEDGPGICKAGNPNVLSPDAGTSRLAQGPAAHSCLVGIRLERP